MSNLGTVSLNGGGGGAGTVTSVAMSVPTQFSVAGSPVTTSGTLAVSWVAQVANRVLAGPSSGADAAPTFRALVNDDLPIVSVGKGGTGTAIGIIPTGTMLVSDGTGTFKAFAVGSANQALRVNSAGTDPEWGTLGVAGGGTGVTSNTAYAVLCGGTTSGAAIQSVSGVGTAGQVLTSNGAGALPTWQDAGAGSGANTALSNLAAVAINTPLVFGSGVGATVTGSVANSGTNVGVTLNNNVTLSGSTKLLSVQNNGTEKMAVDDEGNVYVQPGTSGSTECSLRIADATNAPGGVYGNGSGDGNARTMALRANQSSGGEVTVFQNGINVLVRTVSGGAGPLQVLPTGKMCYDYSAGSIGDTYHVKSAESGGNFSYFYDGTEAWRDDGTSFRTLASRGLRLFTAIGDTNPVGAGLTSSGMQLYNGAFALTHVAPTLAASSTLTWPAANASGVLTNNGSGTLSWSAAGSATWESSAGQFRAVPAAVTAGDYFYYNASVANSGTNVAHVFNNSVALTDGRFLFDFRNNGTSMLKYGPASISFGGSFTADRALYFGDTNGDTLYLGGEDTGSGYIGLVNNATNTSTAAVMAIRGTDYGVSATADGQAVWVGAGLHLTTACDLKTIAGSKIGFGCGRYTIPTYFTKSAATGGNFSYFYDSAEITRDDGTNFRFLQSRKPGIYNAIGDSAARATWGGNQLVNTTEVGNVGTGVDDLQSVTLLANTLITNGDRVDILASGIYAGNANNKTIALVFGGTTLLSAGPVAANGGAWMIRATVIRTGATAQICAACYIGSSLVAATVANSTPAETLSGAITIKTQGEATSNDDVVSRILTVDYFPVK